MTTHELRDTIIAELAKRSQACRDAVTHKGEHEQDDRVRWAKAGVYEHAAEIVLAEFAAAGDIVKEAVTAERDECIRLCDESGRRWDAAEDNAATHGDKVTAIAANTAGSAVESLSLSMRARRTR